jgi:hypothetical protein
VLDKNQKLLHGGKKVKIVSLCHSGDCCPAIKIDEEHVEIGEKDNICILSKSEWEVLKQKILDKEI